MCLFGQIDEEVFPLVFTQRYIIIFGNIRYFPLTFSESSEKYQRISKRLSFWANQKALHFCSNYNKRHVWYLRVYKANWKVIIYQANFLWNQSVNRPKFHCSIWFSNTIFSPADGSENDFILISLQNSIRTDYRQSIISNVSIASAQELVFSKWKIR